MKAVKSSGVPFTLAFFLAPMVILLHECGHYAVYSLQGHHPVLYSSQAWADSSASTWFGQLLGAAAGPMVETSLCVAGLVWLRLRQQRRQDKEAMALDWLATCMAMCCLRWVLQTPRSVWNHHRTGRYGMDEAWISTHFGLPGWVLLLVLFIASVGVLILTVQQHPKSRRVVPFTGLLLGAGSGGLLWLLVLGPELFGQQPAPWRLLPKVIVPPKVVSLVPANGAADVAPGLAEIRVTFDRPMRDNCWAWCGAGPHFPERIGTPYYDSSRTVWSVSVKLKADWEYVFQLNSDQYRSFVSEEGASLEPLLVRFQTASAERAL